MEIYIHMQKWRRSAENSACWSATWKNLVHQMFQGRDKFQCAPLDEESMAVARVPKEGGCVKSIVLIIASLSDI